MPIPPKYLESSSDILLLWQYAQALEIVHFADFTWVEPQSQLLCFVAYGLHAWLMVGLA